MAKLHQDIKKWLEKLANDDNVSIETIIDVFKKATLKELLRRNESGQYEVIIDFDDNKFEVLQSYLVVESKDDKNYDKLNTLTLSEAKKISPTIDVGETLKKEIDLTTNGKENAILISNINKTFKYLKNVKINEKDYEDWKNNIGMVLSLEVENSDFGKYIIALGNGLYGICPREEQTRGETLKPGEKYLFYVKEVNPKSKDWPVVLSRTEKQIVVSLLTANVPELADRRIEVKAISRIPGYKTKILVASNEPSLNPLLCIIGPRGVRINAVKESLGGREGIDVTEYESDLLQQLIKIAGSNIFVGWANEENKLLLICPDDGESLKRLIGPEGKNIQLIKNLLSERIGDKDLEIITKSEAVNSKIDFQEVDSNRFHVKASKDSIQTSASYSKPKEKKDNFVLGDYED